MILVSACLAGETCRYDGRSNLIPAIRAMVEAGKAVTVCPEVDGGLSIPRAPSEIQPDGRVVNNQGQDVTAEYERGASIALAACRANHCSCAILKARSPSCGKGTVYDGTFSHVCVPGNGITAELLLANGIAVYTDEELGKAMETERMEDHA